MLTGNWCVDLDGPPVLRTTHLIRGGEDTSKDAISRFYRLLRGGASLLGLLG